MFTATLFTIARTWKQSRCPPTNEWIKKLWYIYTVEYCCHWLSHVWLFVTPWTAEHQASLSITNSRSSPKPTSIVLVMPSNYLILCRPVLWPSIFPSIRVFSNELALRMRWPKYWNFSFSINLSKEYPGLISVRVNWLDLLAVQGTLKSLLQHHSSKASILQHSAFFTVQLKKEQTVKQAIGLKNNNETNASTLIVKIKI